MINTANTIYVPEYSRVEYSHFPASNMLTSLRHSNSFYYVSRRPQSTRIIFDHTLNIFIDKNSQFDNKSIYLFRKVKTSALQFIEQNSFDIPPELPVSFTNAEFSKPTDLIGTDINHAYWKIALNNGIITEETYDKGLAYKTTSLASLSVLGRNCQYEAYQGIKMLERCAIGGNKKLQDLYKYIRYSCYGYMNDIKEELADDFYKWKTDEIIYSKEPKNIELVHDYLTDKNLTFKDTPYEKVFSMV